MTNFFGSVEAETTFDSGAKSFEDIPDNTQLVACVTDGKWDEYEGEEYINLTWTVLDGDYKNRKVFQKIKCKNSDTGKAQKALRMLAAIDKNAGGELMKLGTEPSSDDIAMHLSNKPMAIKVLIWEINGKSGNWIAAVSPVNGTAGTQHIAASKPSPPAMDDFDDDLPF